MPEETSALDFFSSIPSDYGGSATATMEPPVREREENPDPVKAETAPVAPKAPEKPASTASPDDLLSPGDRKEGEKSPKQYAQERREAKEKKRELLEKAPVLEEENARLKAEHESLQKRLAELEEMTSRERAEEGFTREDVETLRARAEAAEKRYIAANGPAIDPYQDEEVVRYSRAVEDALKANLPKVTRKADGTTARINLEILRKQPERKEAMNTAVAQYAMSLDAGDEAGLDKAAMLMSTALGGLDMEDDDVRAAVETALSAAAEPFVKGIQRFKHVQENAVTFASQRRAEQIRDVETRLLQPLQFDPAVVDERLEENPSHPWANFGKLVNELPDDVRKEIMDDLRQDALVVGAYRYVPPPLPANATAAQIADHEALVRAAEERGGRAVQYLAVGRAMIEGGLLAHLRAQVVEMKERLDESAGSTTLPRPGSGGTSEKKPDSAGIWDSISSDYRRT